MTTLIPTLSTTLSTTQSINTRKNGIITLFVVMAIALLTALPGHADDMARTGTFSGLSNHVTTGSATITKEDGAYVIVLGEDFTFDGAPDPKVALGKDGKFDPATLLEPLRSNSGTQTYAIPASIDVSAFNEVYIWCEKYSVGLGVAALN